MLTKDSVVLRERLRVGFRLQLTAVLTAAVLAGLVQAPARAADDVPGARCDRASVLEMWRTGGPSLKIAAADALVSGDDVVCALLERDAEDERRADERLLVAEMTTAGPTMK